MNNFHSLLPSELNAMAGNISSGFGIDLDTTVLLMLEAVAFAAGTSVLVRTPDRCHLRPTFNLALVSDGAGFPRGAFATLVSPVTEFVRSACEQQRGRGTDATKMALEARMTALAEVRSRIATNEAALRGVVSKNASAQKLSEHVSLQGDAITPDEFDAARASKFDFQEQARLEESVARDCKILPEIESAVQLLHLAAAPGILVDEPEWRSIPDLSHGSFDGLTMGLCFSGVRELSIIRAKEMTTIARSLTGTDGKVKPNIIACANGDVWSHVLVNPAVSKSGIFCGFVFSESKETGDCDPAAIEAASGDRAWERLCKNLLLARMSRTQRVLLLDHDGFQKYAQFRGWCRQESPPSLRAYLECWPDLCLRLALTHAIISEADSIPADYIDRAAEYLKSRLAQTGLLIESLTTEETPEQQRESRIERVCRRLNNGPLTKRGIVRTLHRQDYSAVEQMITEALEAGRIERRGDFFFAVNVSVSASAS